MASAPGATTVRGSEQSLPQQARSQPGGLGAACASFLPPRVPGEMWQKLLPCRKAHGFLPGQTWVRKKKVSSMALGVPALGGTQDHRHS